MVITRFNRPAVVVTSFEDSMPKEEWENGFELVERLRGQAVFEFYC